MSQADNTQNITNQKRTTTKTTRALSTQDCESVALPCFHGKLEVGKEPELWFCQLSDMGCNHKNFLPLCVICGERSVGRVAESLEPLEYSPLSVYMRSDIQTLWLICLLQGNVSPFLVEHGSCWPCTAASPCCCSQGALQSTARGVQHHLSVWSLKGFILGKFSRVSQAPV